MDKEDMQDLVVEFDRFTVEQDIELTYNESEVVKTTIKILHKFIKKR